MSKTTNEIENIAVKVSSAAERKIRQGHPWVFEDSITKQNKDEKAGDLAIIYGKKKNKVLAIGLFDPLAIIRIRIIHFGGPEKIDQAFFAEKLQLAFTRREKIMQSETNAFRWVFGENDGFPGLILDNYDRHLVIKLYSSIWFAWLSDLIGVLGKNWNPKSIILRLNRKLQVAPHTPFKDGSFLIGEAFNGEVEFLEHGVMFKANLIKGHKTGFFLDHRHNRLAIQKLAKNATVLDLFSYAGGFSIHALAGGAQSVCSVDISEKALKLAKENALINDFENRMKYRCMDVFEFLQSDKNTYDLIIVDPPAFASRNDQQAKALKSYKKLFHLAMNRLNTGGTILLASCSSRISFSEFEHLIKSLISDSSSAWKITHSTRHDIDHPHGVPELDYLKSFYLKKL